MLYPDSSDGRKFRVSQARNAFTAFTLYLFENFDTERKVHCLSARSASRPWARSTDSPRTTVATCGRTARPEHQAVPEQGREYILRQPPAQADETFASIMGTFKEPLNAWIYPVLDEATSRNDFLLADVRKKKMTIYIGIQPNKLAESRLIINPFFSQLINVNTRELPKNSPELKHSAYC
jgi:type IV secretion system protein VirD4